MMVINIVMNYRTTESGDIVKIIVMMLTKFMVIIVMVIKM